MFRRVFSLKTIHFTLKTLGLAFSVLFLSFLGTLFLYQAAAYIVPTNTPPLSNLALPLNVSPTLQEKTGPLGATALYDTNDYTYFLDPSNTSKLGGPLSLSNNQIKNVKDPVDPQDAATKGYVDQIASKGLYPSSAGLTFASAWTGVSGESGDEDTPLVAADDDGYYFSVNNGNGLEVRRFSSLDKLDWLVSIDFSALTGSKNAPKEPWALSPDWNGGLYVLIQASTTGRTGFLVHVKADQTYKIAAIGTNPAIPQDHPRVRVLKTGEIFISTHSWSGFNSWLGAAKLREDGSVICQTPFITNNGGAVEIDSQGYVYTSDNSGNSLYKFDKNCQFLQKITGSLPSSGQTYNMVADSQGNIFTYYRWGQSSYWTWYHQKFLADGQEQWVKKVDEPDPNAVTLAMGVDRNGDLITAKTRLTPDPVTGQSFIKRGLLLRKYSGQTGALISQKISYNRHAFGGGNYSRVLFFDRFNNIATGIAIYDDFAWAPRVTTYQMGVLHNN